MPPLLRLHAPLLRFDRFSRVFFCLFLRFKAKNRPLLRFQLRLKPLTSEVFGFGSSTSDVKSGLI